MKIPRATSAAMLVALVLVVGFNIYYFTDWFRSEPVYHGKTVTEWVDKIALFDAERKGQNDYSLRFSPETVENDPALRVLIKLGSKATPILEKRLTEVSRQGSHFEMARRMSAAFVLLTLGTNANAGVSSVLSAVAAAPSDDIGNQVAAGDAYSACEAANYGLPFQHAEIVAGIMEGLTNANASCRMTAANLTRTFRDELPLWKNDLLKLTKDDDEGVRSTALWALVTTDPKDSEIMHLAEETLKDQTNPARLRALAASGLGLAGVTATNSLPLLREALNDTNKFLQSEARRAIQWIEKPTVSN